MGRGYGWMPRQLPRLTDDLVRPHPIVHLRQSRPVSLLSRHQNADGYACGAVVRDSKGRSPLSLRRQIRQQERHKRLAMARSKHVFDQP